MPDQGPQLETKVGRIIMSALRNKMIHLKFSAKSLLFHPILFEVPSLKLLAAHALVRINYMASFYIGGQQSFLLNLWYLQDSGATSENSQYGTVSHNTVMATMVVAGEEVQYKLSATSSHEKLGTMLFHQTRCSTFNIQPISM